MTTWTPSTMGRKGGRSRNPEKTKHLRRGNPKLTPAEVADIRASELTTAQLTAQYAGRIGARQIARIRKGESWSGL